MSTKAERRAELEAQMAELDNEPDDDEEFEIEIYGPEGHGARLPYRKGKTYLQQHFGIDADSLPKPGDGKPAGKTPAKSSKRNTGENPEGDEGDGDPQSLSFFQRRQQQRESAQ